MQAVSRVLAARGAVVATANHPDLCNCTSRYRARPGRVWRFDPQQVPHEFWWNPLRLVPRCSSRVRNRRLPFFSSLERDSVRCGQLRQKRVRTSLFLGVAERHQGEIGRAGVQQPLELAFH
jgi:hypothetical protein